MKKQILTLVLLLISVVGFSQSRFIDAKNYVISRGYTIAEEGSSSASQGGSVYTFRTFYSNLDYVVYACSNDDDVQDVDLYVINPSGTTFIKDNDTDRIAVVSFSLYNDIRFKIQAFNHSSLTPYSSSIIRYFVAYK